MLINDTEIVRGFREWLVERSDHHENKMPRSRLRHAAGFSLGQAAALLGVTKETLMAIESEHAEPLPWLHQKLIRLYHHD
jgi:DNA-binding XRE family transcriptional regulator